MKMPKRVEFTIDDDIADRLDKAALQQGKSRNELGNEYFKHGLECKKLAEKIPKVETMKQIRNQFANKHCREPSCNKEIQVSESCWWGRDETGKSFLVCGECYERINLDGQSNPESLKLILINRKLRKENLELTKVRNFLIDEINRAVAKDSIPELRRIESEAAIAKAEGWQIHNRYHRGKIGTPEERAFFGKLVQRLGEFDIIIQTCQQKIREIALNPKLTRNLKELLMDAEAAPLGIRQAVRVGETEETDTEKFINDPEAAKKAREPIPDGGLDDAGRTYCPFAGLRVFPLRCEKCKQDNYAQWDTCQKQKQKQEQDKSTK